MTDCLKYTLWTCFPKTTFGKKMTSGSDNFDKEGALYNLGFRFQTMRNMLHVNNGDGSYSEIGQLSGISNTDWSWAALFADFDLDGWKGLFVTNGYKSDYTNMDFMSYAADQQMKVSETRSEQDISDLLAKIPSISLPNYIYQNNGDLTFSDKTSEWGFYKNSLSNGSAYADLDNDGDNDLFVGGRLIPGNYPNALRSYILENNGMGYFTDVTKDVNPELMSPEMVTDA